MFKDIPVRFFIIRADNEDGEIEYQRHTVFNNGVSQICLTKNPF